MVRLLPEVPSHRSQPGSRVACASMHPTEPLIAVGLSTGELCVFTCRTDGVTALFEYEEVVALLSGGRPGHGAAAAPHPAKVLRVDSEGFALRHCLFVKGREDDILREVLHPLIGAYSGNSGCAGRSTSSADSMKAIARHLVICITEMNSVYLIDVDNGALLLHWDCSSNSSSGLRTAHSSGSKAVSRDSPFASHRTIVHAANYGALLFLAVADRVSRVVERKVYVCHLTATDPFLPATAVSRIQPAAANSGGGSRSSGSSSRSGNRATTGGSKAAGPYVITLRTSYHGIEHPHEKRLLKRQTSIRLLRVHPLAPVLLVGMSECVYVFTSFTDNGEKLPPAAIIATRESLRDVAFRKGSGSSGNCNGTIVDANFLATNVVLRGGRGLLADNLQIALLTRNRASVLDLTRASSKGILDEQAFCTPVTPHALTIRENCINGSNGNGGGGAPSAQRTVPVHYERLYTWVGSPGILIVEQSDGTALEYSRNDVAAPLTRVLTVRSRIRKPQVPQTAAASSSAPQVHVATCARRGEAAPAPATSSLPLWGILDTFPTDPRILRANPSINASGERRVVFSRATGRAQLYTAVCGYAQAVHGNSGHEEGPLVTSIMAATDTTDCSAITFTAILAVRGTLESGKEGGQGGPTINSDNGGARGGRPVGAMLLDAPARLLHMEHGYYFVGGRANASAVFVVAGLVYSLESLDGYSGASNGHPHSSGSGDSCTGAEEVHSPVVRAALLSLPARGDSGVVQVAHLPLPELPPASAANTGSSGTGTGSGDGVVEEATCGERRSATRMDLLSVSFQPSNDDTAPGVWALWSPRRRPPPPLPSTSDASAGSSPASLPSILTFQSYLISAEGGSVVWGNNGKPETVHIDDPLYQSPSQVFAQSAVGGAQGTWPLEPPSVAQLFLYYEESQVLALGTVVRGSPYIASRGNSSPFQLGSVSGCDSAGGDQVLRFQPQAVLSISGWSKHGNNHHNNQSKHRTNYNGAGNGRSFANAIKLTATRSTDGSALLVAMACRRHGFVVMQFPALAQRLAAPAPAPSTLMRPTDEAMLAAAMGNNNGHGTERGGATIYAREKILFSRRWVETESMWAGSPATGAADPLESSSNESSPEEEEDHRIGGGGQPAGAISIKLVRTYAPVNLFEWVFLASGSGGSAVTDGARSRIDGGRDGEQDREDGGVDEDDNTADLQTPSSIATPATRCAGTPHSQSSPSMTSRANAATAEAALLASLGDGAVPFLVLQRHRKLLVVHLNGAIVPLCPAITSSIPIGVSYSFAGTAITNSGVHATGETRVGEGNHNSSHPNPGSRSPSPTATVAEMGKEGNDPQHECADGTGGEGDPSTRPRGGRELSLPIFAGGAGRGSGGGINGYGTRMARLRVHLIYGDYLSGLAGSLRQRQTWQQEVFFADADTVAVQQARTNTPASPFWLLGAGKRGKRRGGAPSTGVKREAASETGATDEHVAAKARLQSLQMMQTRLTQYRNASASATSGDSSGSAVTTVSSSSHNCRSTAVQSGECFHMDVTESLSTAVLKMQGMITVQAITDLVTSSTFLSQFIRDTFRSFAHRMRTAVVFGNLQTAEMIAAVPLASVTYCLSHEVRLLIVQQRKQFGRRDGATGGNRSTQQQDAARASHSASLSTGSTTDLLVAQRARRQWWMLVMRSYTLVRYLHPSESEDSFAAVQQTRQLAPQPFFPLKGDGSSCTYTAEVIAELLLYCPHSEQPPQLWQANEASAARVPQEWPSAVSNVPCSPSQLVQSVFVALTLLGASTTITARKEKELAASAQNRWASRDGEPTSTTAAAAPGGGYETKEAYAASLRDVIASLPVDGQHWQNAVFYCHMVENLCEIAGGNDWDGESTNDNPSHASPCARTAGFLAEVLAAEGNQMSTMQWVLEVAAPTVAILTGVPYQTTSSRHRAHCLRRNGEDGNPSRCMENSNDPTGKDGAGSVDDAESTDGSEMTDEQRKRRMNTAVAQSISARMKVLEEDGDEGAAAAALAWHKLEKHGLDVVTTSHMRRDREAADAAATERQRIQQLQQQQRQQAAARVKATASESPLDQDDYFEKGIGLLARLDELRAGVYARQWRALFDAAAYPSCYVFQSASTAAPAAGGGGAVVNGYPLAHLPCQVWPKNPAPSNGASAATAKHSKAESAPPPQAQSSIKAQAGAAPPTPPVSVSRRVMPLEQQVANVREAYAFGSASGEARPGDTATAAAAATGSGDGGDVSSEDHVAQSLHMPRYRFTGESAVNCQRAEATRPQRALDDGDYKSRFMKDGSDDEPVFF